MEACWRLSGLEPRVAENALLSFPGLPVIICLFIRTPADAEAPAATLFLTHQNNSIFTPLIYGATGTDSETPWIQTVIADAGDIEEDHPLKLKEGLPFRLSQRVEVNIIPGVHRRATEVIVPVRTGLDILVSAGYHRDGSRRRLVCTLRCVEKVLILVCPRFIIVIHVGQVWIEEEVGKYA
jgi:hypothetical protein